MACGGDVTPRAVKNDGGNKIGAQLKRERERERLLIGSIHIGLL